MDLSDQPQTLGYSQFRTSQQSYQLIYLQTNESKRCSWPLVWGQCHGVAHTWQTGVRGKTVVIGPMPILNSFSLFGIVFRDASWSKINNTTISVLRPSSNYMWKNTHCHQSPVQRWELPWCSWHSVEQPISTLTTYWKHFKLEKGNEETESWVICSQLLNVNDEEFHRSDALAVFQTKRACVTFQHLFPNGSNQRPHREQCRCFQAVVFPSASLRGHFTC